MMNSKLKSFVLNPLDSFDKSNIKMLLDGIINFSDEKIVITDENFQISLSNFPYVSCGENALKKLKIKEKECFGKIIRHLYLEEKEKVTYEIKVKKLTEETTKEEMYLFFLKEISQENEYKDKFLKLKNFLKHELATPLISQILALKLVLKSKKNNYLIPEILYSTETSYRILKNNLEEIDFEENDLKLQKKKITLSQFIQTITESCKIFLSAKNTTMTTNIVAENKIFADGEKLKKAIENILFQINERCKENSQIILKAEVLQSNLRFEILAPFEFEEKDIFNKKANTSYTKLAHNNGLYLAKKIITMHEGRILIQKRCDRTSLKIILPSGIINKK